MTPVQQLRARGWTVEQGNWITRLTHPDGRDIRTLDVDKVAKELLAKRRSYYRVSVKPLRFATFLVVVAGLVSAVYLAF